MSQAPGASLRNAPALGVDAGSLEIREVTVLRDLHYGAQGSFGTSESAGLSPCKVPEGQVFLLGDLSHRSHDSRHFGPVPLELRLGRPIAHYRPWDRAGWLDPAGLSR